MLKASEKTHASGHAGTYNVARDDLYLRELLFEFVAPPPTLGPSKSHVLGGTSATAPSSAADLMLMGFPQLVQGAYSGMCSCHVKLRTHGYECPRCKSRICDVPTECKVCSLTVVNAAQLARSYRHLFPVSGDLLQSHFIRGLTWHLRWQTTTGSSCELSGCPSLPSACTDPQQIQPQTQRVVPLHMFLLFVPVPTTSDDGRAGRHFAAGQVRLPDVRQPVLSRLRQTRT